MIRPHVIGKSGREPVRKSEVDTQMTTESEDLMASDTVPAAVPGPNDPPATPPAGDAQPGLFTSMLAPVEPARTAAFTLNPTTGQDTPEDAVTGPTSAAYHTDENTPGNTATGSGRNASTGQNQSIWRAWMLAGAERWRKGAGAHIKRLEIEKAKAQARQVKESRTVSVKQSNGPSGNSWTGSTGGGKSGDGKPSGSKTAGGGGAKGPKNPATGRGSAGGSGAGSGSSGRGSEASGGRAEGRGQSGTGTSGSAGKPNGPTGASGPRNSPGTPPTSPKQPRGAGGTDSSKSAKTDQSKGGSSTGPAAAGTSGGTSGGAKPGPKGSTGAPGNPASGTSTTTKPNGAGARDTSSGARAVNDKNPSSAKPPAGPDKGLQKTVKKPGTDTNPTPAKTGTPAKNSKTSPDAKTEPAAPTARRTPGKPLDTRESRETGYRDGTRAGRTAAHVKAYRDGFKDGWRDTSEAADRQKTRLDKAHQDRKQQRHQDKKDTPVTGTPTSADHHAPTSPQPIPVAHIDATHVQLGDGAARQHMSRGEVRSLKQYERRLTEKATGMTRVAEDTKGLLAHAEEQAREVTHLVEAARSVHGGDNLAGELARLQELANVQVGHAEEIHVRAVRAAEATRAVLTNVETRYGGIYKAVVDAPDLLAPGELAFYKG